MGNTYSEKIISLIENNKDPEKAEKMSAYMRHKFIFAGIQRPKLNDLIKTIIRETSGDELDWKLVFDLWDYEYREAQYAALAYLKRHVKQIYPEDISRLEKLITHKSWWDTVDNIDDFVGELVKKDGGLKKVMLKWSESGNIWLRRVAINYQQKYKEDTDLDMLEKIILANLGSREFFINKAIGWSLREYAKVDPEWVMDFVGRYRDKMGNLSIKEAIRNI